MPTMHPDASRAEKPCCACKTPKKMDEFAIKNKLTGQRQSRCRACQKLSSRSHYEKNRETVIARSATNAETRKDVLQQAVAGRLRDAKCSCCAGTTDLTFRVNANYHGPRVSAVVNNSMAMDTLVEAMANSTIVCRPCMWADFGTILKDSRAALAAGTAEPKRIPAAVYKKRHTLALADRRSQRFERSLGLVS